MVIATFYQNCKSQKSQAVNGIVRKKSEFFKTVKKKKSQLPKK